MDGLSQAPQRSRCSSLPPPVTFLIKGFQIVLGSFQIAYFEQMEGSRYLLLETQLPSHPLQGDSEHRILFIFLGYGLPFFCSLVHPFPQPMGIGCQSPLLLPARPPSARTLSLSCKCSKKFCQKTTPNQTKHTTATQCAGICAVWQPVKQRAPGEGPTTAALFRSKG